MPAPGRRPVLTPLPGEGDLGLVDALAQLTFAVQGALGAADSLEAVVAEVAEAALRLSPRATRSASSVEDDDNPPADTYSHLRLPGSGHAGAVRPIGGRASSSRLCFGGLR